MSLIHWWPLATSSLIDNITGVSLTNNNSATFTNSGKIGGAYSFSGANNCSLKCNWQGENSTHQLSIGFWIKLDSTWSGWGQVLTIGKLGTSWTDIRFGVDIESSKVVRFSISDGANATSYSGPYSTALSTGIWYHITVTYDNKIMKMYVDGSAVSSNFGYESSITPSLNGCNISIGGNSSEAGECSICDVRIYDHALSQAEVKELSKALIVHYTFDDMLAESTTNVSTVSGWSTYSSYWTISERTETGLKLYRHTGSTSDCVAIQNSAVTSQMVQGDIWTFSCFLYKNGQPYKSTSSGISSEGYGYKTVSWESHDDGYYRITFQIISSPGAWVLHNYFFSPIDKGVDCEMRYMQFEKKDHATPYTPTSRASMIVDESGYDHPTILVNNCKFVTDTNSGTLALHTAGSGSTASFGECSYLRADMKTYITPTAFTISMWAKVNTWGKQTSGVLSLNTGTDPTGYLTSTFVQYDGNFRLNNSASTAQSSISSGIITLGEWHHYAFTWDGTNLRGYKDGALYSTAAAAFTPDPFNYVFLGVDRAGGAVRDADVTWGNFRIYMTALSESDIVELYKTKAYITDQGDIEAHQFIEDKIQAQVTSKYCFEAGEFYEELYPGYDVLEYIESSGTQYIDTGYIATSTDYTYELDMAPTKIGGFYSYIGFMASGTTPRAGIHEYSNTFMIGANATTNSSVTPVVNERMVLKNHCKSGAQKLYKNNVQIASNSTTFNHSSNTLTTHIFGRNYSSGRNLSSIKLYEAKIYEGSTLVRHYIPVRRQSDNAFGLYELLNGTFHANSGSGTFVSGPAITNKSASIYKDQHVSGRTIIEL